MVWLERVQNVSAMMMPIRKTMISEQDFVNCYRGIAVNIRYIWRIEKDKLYMAEEFCSFKKTIPVSRRMYKSVNQKFIDYNKNT